MSGTGAISVDDARQSQDPRLPRRTTAPVRVADWGNPLMKSDAAEFARSQFETLKLKGERMQDLDRSVKDWRDAWLRVYEEAHIQHEDSRDNITMQNINNRVKVVFQAIEADKPIPPNCRELVKRRAKEAPGREAARRAAEDENRNEDPFSVLLEAPSKVPADGRPVSIPSSATNPVAVPPGRRHLDGVYRRTPAFFSERQKGAAPRTLGAQLKTAEEIKKAEAADTRKQDKQRIGSRKPGPLATRSASRPQTRANVNNEAGNGLELHDNDDALSDDAQTTGESQSANEPGQKPETGEDGEQGERRTNQLSAKNSGDRIKITKDKLKVPTTGFVADLKQEHIKWILSWIERWETLADRKEIKENWLAKNPDVPKQDWAWWRYARDDFNEKFPELKVKMGPTIIKNGVQRGDIWAMHKHFEQKAIKEANLAKPSNMTVVQKGQHRPRPIARQQESQPDTVGLRTNSQGQAALPNSVSQTEGTGRAQRGSMLLRTRTNLKRGREDKDLHNNEDFSQDSSRHKRLRRGDARADKPVARRSGIVQANPRQAERKKSLIVVFHYNGPFPPKLKTKVKIVVPKSSTATAEPSPTRGVEAQTSDGEGEDDGDVEMAD